MKNKYGICYWLLNREKTNVLIDTPIDFFDKLSPQGKVFKIDIYNEDYYNINYGKESFIILKESIRIIEDTKDNKILEIDQKIKNYKNQEGSIVERYWHFKEEKVFYIIEIDGKKSSKRYFLEDLIEIDHVSD